MFRGTVLIFSVTPFSFFRIEGGQGADTLAPGSDSPPRAIPHHRARVVQARRAFSGGVAFSPLWRGLAQGIRRLYPERFLSASTKPLAPATGSTASRSGYSSAVCRSLASYIISKRTGCSIQDLPEG